MKCCQSTMTVAGSRLSDDETKVLTTYLCHTCFRRVVHSENNPRYMPMRQPLASDVGPVVPTKHLNGYARYGITAAPPLTKQQVKELGEHKPNGIFARVMRNPNPMNAGV